MREIKFRAWDGSNMLDPVSIKDILSGDRSLQVNMLKERWALMQYTGLKDRNGVEIYEGDILNHYDRDAKIEDYKIVVEWRLGGLCFIFPESWHAISGFHLDGADTYEVIGNIYENTELLDKKMAKEDVKNKEQPTMQSKTYKDIKKETSPNTTIKRELSISVKLDEDHNIEFDYGYEKPEVVMYSESCTTLNIDQLKELSLAINKMIEEVEK